MSWRQYRPIEAGEYIIAGGDCSQGGKDKNTCQFYSKTKMDIPLVYQERGVAVQMTTELFPLLEKICEVTGIPPVIGLERNNGGASELERLNNMNRLNKYKIFMHKPVGHKRTFSSTKFGWDITAYSRGAMLGDLKDAIDKAIIKIYDEPTINELWSFVEVFRGGRWQGEADAGMNDDLVMALAGVWMMSQQVKEPVTGNRLKVRQVWDNSFIKKYL